jgi:hypothetical protein
VIEDGELTKIVWSQEPVDGCHPEPIDVGIAQFGEDLLNVLILIGGRSRHALKL